MILFVTTADHRYTLKYLVPKRVGRSRSRVVSYDWLFRQSSLTAACVVFTDLDRLRHHELASAGALARQIEAQGARILNDPARCRQRYDLLHHLHCIGINRFRVYKAVVRPRPERFPVFLKCESNHRQDFETLLPDQCSLERKLDEVIQSGVALRDLLVIEFANTARRKGIYQRRTMFRVGDTFISGNPVNEDKPFVKYGTEGLTSDEELAEMARFMRTNPDAPVIAKAFEAANIEYGRLDYGLDGDSFAVYEINTNPQIGVSIPGDHEDFFAAVSEGVDALAKAMRALDGQDRKVRLAHHKGYFSRLRFKFGFELKQP